MEKVKLKKIQMKENGLLPYDIRDYREGLVLDYDFEETGLTVYDQSHKIPYGYLDGVDDYINCGNDLSLDITEKITMIVHFVPDSVTGGWEALIDKSWENYAIAQNDKRISFKFFDGSNYQEKTFANDVFSVREPVTVAVTYDSTKSTNNLKLIVNGILNEEVNFDYGAINSSPSSNLIISGKPDHSYLATGDMRKVEIYSRILSLQELLQEHQNKYVDPANRELSYNFNRKNDDDTTVYDISGNSNDGVVTGMIFKNQPTNGTITGATRTQGMGDLMALSFDGVDDYIETTDSTSINVGTSNFSILLLIKIEDNLSVQSIINKYSGVDWANSDYSVGWEILYRGDYLSKDVQFRLNDGGILGTTCDTDATIPDISDGDTHMLVVTVDRVNSVVRIYLDGINYGGTDNISNITGSLDNDSNLICATRQAKDGYFSVLNANCIRIYKNIILTPEQIKNQYLFFKNKAGLI